MCRQSGIEQLGNLAAFARLVGNAVEFEQGNGGQADDQRSEGEVDENNLGLQGAHREKCNSGVAM